MRIQGFKIYGLENARKAAACLRAKIQQNFMRFSRPYSLNPQSKALVSIIVFFCFLASQDGNTRAVLRLVPAASDREIRAGADTVHRHPKGYHLIQRLRLLMPALQPARQKTC